jgi:2-oxoglutarate ferredoxin oxidoreductase subunit gamma
MAELKEREILIAGFGGQGIILAGNILGKAATLFDRQHATLTQSYGPEARGGSCTAQVILSANEILFPYVERPEMLVCMSQEGLAKNVHLLSPGGILIWDTDLVKVADLDPSFVAYHVPATRFAEEMGNQMMANIVMLGFISAVSDLVTVEALKQAVLESVPPKTREKNEAAFNRGREYGEAILKSRSNLEKSREQ